MREVLVCDDDDAIRELLKRVLSRSGFVVDVARDGDDALTKMCDRDYALLVLDLMMPRVNGYDVVERLRSRTKRPPVVVLTATPRVRPDDLDPNVVQAIMKKPFDLEMLVTIAQAVVTVSDDGRPAAAETARGILNPLNDLEGP